MEEKVAQNNSIQSKTIQSKTYLQILPVILSKDSYSIRKNALLETWAMNIFETTTMLKNKYYEIGLLWTTDNPRLPMDRELAENRLVSLEKRLERNPVL